MYLLSLQPGNNTSSVGRAANARLAAENLFEFQFGIDGLGAEYPESHQSVEYGQFHIYNGVDSVFEIARASECHGTKKIRVLYCTFQLRDSQARQSSL